MLGPTFGYYPNGSKTYLVVKPEHEETARQLFTDTDVNISIEGKRHLGAALGSRTFTEEYVTNKVQGWTQEITCLAEIATTQPHAAYAAFTHGLSSRWSYISRTIPDIHDLLLPLETAILQCLIPAITGRAPCSRQERDLLALPFRLGGLGLTNPATNSSHAFQASERLTAPLAVLIVAQSPDQAVDQTEITAIKKDIRKTNRQRQEDQAKEIHNHLNPKLRRSIALASLLTEVCHNVATEPLMQPLTGETLTLRSANTENGARLDIRAGVFWNRSQDAFFDVRVFHPNAPSNRSTNISSAYRKHEMLKKREYGQRVRDVERGVFTPIVFTTTGGMGREAATFYKRLADMIAGKQQKPYSTVMGWLRCRLSFATLRSAIMCVRGSRSSRHRPIRVPDITLATAEGHVPTTK